MSGIVLVVEPLMNHPSCAATGGGVLGSNTQQLGGLNVVSPGPLPQSTVPGALSFCGWNPMSYVCFPSGPLVRSRSMPAEARGVILGSDWYVHSEPGRVPYCQVIEPDTSS